MALLNVIRDTYAKISAHPVSDGALLFATDTQQIFLDNGSQRVEVGSVQDLANYITSTQLSLALQEEASEREKQDGLLEDNITSSVQTLQNQINAKADASHTHLYAGSATAGGSATSAVKLDTSAGSATQPVYFSGGKPVATTHILAASVPSDAKFTDTTYTLESFGITATSDEINTLDGITATTEQLNFLDTAESDIQTQIDGKSDIGHSHDVATTESDGFMPQLSGDETQYLRGDGSWGSVATGANVVLVQNTEPTDPNCKIWIQV